MRWQILKPSCTRSSKKCSRPGVPHLPRRLERAKADIERFKRYGSVGSGPVDADEAFSAKPIEREPPPPPDERTEKAARIASLRSTRWKGASEPQET